MRFARSPRQSQERSVLSDSDLRHFGPRLAYWVILAVLLGGSLTMLFPLYWMVSSAFKPTVEIYKAPPTLWPAHPTAGTFSQALQIFNFGRYFGNSLVLTLGTLLCNLLVSSLAGYALAKLRPWGHKVILFLFLSTLMVPAQAYLIPQFLTVRSLPLLHLNLLDTPWAIWLPGAVSAFNIFLFKSFFEGIPEDLLEAARIDGAGPMQIFRSIVLPLSRPVFGVVAIFAFTGSWNDFVWPLLVITNEKRQPLTVALYYLANVSNTPWNIVMAVMSLVVLVPIIVFLIFQRQIIRGISFSGLKG
ncbi:MAG: carbohydrate ABC transporter permease [Mycobacterium leprae]